MAQPFIVYRDTVGARSETFVQRQYSAFSELAPIYVGTKRGPLVPKDSVILAKPGSFGAGQRFSFRQLGRIPAALDRLIAERRPRLVHAQFGLGGALALPIARHAKLPLVVTFHGGDATKDKHYEDRRLLRTIFQRRREALMAEARSFLCVSRFVRDTLLARGFPAEKLEVHYLGIEIPESVMLPPICASGTVLFVGRLVEKKGLDTLIDALAALKERGVDLELSVLGEGPLKPVLKRHAEAARVKTHFEGWKSAAEVQKAMRRALLLAVPSRAAQGGDSEGLPTVIMEAMALGVPVVATRHAGIPEIVTDRVTGLLVPESDPAALAEAIMAIKSYPEAAGRMRGEAYADVRARFDARRQSRILERRLMELSAFVGT